MKLYTAPRDHTYINFLSNVLSYTGLSDNVIREIIENKQYMDLFLHTFTHKSAHPENNYEHLELLGDATLYKCMVWYLSYRFPQFNCHNGVKILTRLKINNICKHAFASMAEDLNFWPFISASLDNRKNNKTRMLEDVFEAFFAAVEKIIDLYTNTMGVGYRFCYTLVCHIMDQRDISLRFIDLVDAKTRLKEVFDYFGSNLGNLSYKCQKKKRVFYTQVLLKNIKGKTSVIGEGKGSVKVDSEQEASEQAITCLRERGFSRPIPESYSRLGIY